VGGTGGFDGGGGGGGLYGGGGGGEIGRDFNPSCSCFDGATGGGGGGGGSSFVDPSATSSQILDGVDAPGFGDGVVTITYTQPYAFTGFFQPVANPPVINTVKAGSGVAIKFGLGGNQGLDIFDAGYPASIPLTTTCGTTGAVPEPTRPTGKSGLSYNAATDTYSYNWKTQKAWKGTCRQFDLGLNDDSDHLAIFTFK
jgi:hypothetical protein